MPFSASSHFFQLYSAPPISKHSSPSSTSSVIRGSPYGWPSRKSSSPPLQSSFSTLLGFLSSEYSRIWTECKKRTDLNLRMFKHSLKVWSLSNMLQAFLILYHWHRRCSFTTYDLWWPSIPSTTPLLSSKQALDWSESTSNDLQWPPMTDWLTFLSQ